MGEYTDISPEILINDSIINERQITVLKTGGAAAWILRHPANMQLIAGTMTPDRLSQICKAADVTLTRSE